MRDGGVLCTPPSTLTTAMDIGLCLPYMKNGLDRDCIRQWCLRADAGPFSSISCGERITGPEETLDMRVTLAFAAALTERVRIVPSLYILPLHSAALVAQEVATLDRLSNGRVQLCVGVGGREKDYQSADVSFQYRHPRMDRQIEKIKRIWAGEPVVKGADPVGCKPYQIGGPKILAGVMGPVAMARAAHWADGIYAWSMSGAAEEIEKLFALADRAWSDAGRDSAPKKIAGFWCCRSMDSATQLKHYIYQYIVGTTGDAIANAVASTAKMHSDDAIARGIDAIQELAADELLLVPATSDISELDALEKIIQSR